MIFFVSFGHYDLDCQYCCHKISFIKCSFLIFIMLSRSFFQFLHSWSWISRLCFGFMPFWECRSVKFFLDHSDPNPFGFSFSFQYQSFPAHEEIIICAQNGLPKFNTTTNVKALRFGNSLALFSRIKACRRSESLRMVLLLQYM